MLVPVDMTFPSISAYMGMRKEMSILLMPSGVLREPWPSGLALAVTDGV